MKGKTVIITDDGLAAGYTMPAAGEVICLLAKDTHHFAVASFYRDFPDLSDEEVRAYLLEAWERERAWK